MTFKVRLTRDAEADLERLFDFLEFRALHDRLYEALATFGIGAASRIHQPRGVVPGGWADEARCPGGTVSA